MQLDSTAAAPAKARRPTPASVYRRRRERANAAVLAAVAAEGPEAFDISIWRRHTRATACGTSACYLGWLAALRHNGWRFTPGRFPDPYRDDVSGMGAAARYFGLHEDDAYECFGLHHPTSDRPATGPHGEVTAEDVAGFLLTRPVVVHGA